MTRLAVDMAPDYRRPFLVDGPAIVRFSGGRTSGMMLRQILDAHGGALPSNVHVVFSNTGKERIETLDFIEECSQRWQVRIRWTEYRPEAPFVVEVDHATASRNGEPFRAMVLKERYMPNPSKRICTKNLKLRTNHRFARRFLGFVQWTDVIGLRFDEYDRVMNVRAQPVPKRVGAVEVATPLADARVTVADVGRFWRAQPFDLRLGSGEGNCDNCFLKPPDLRLQLIAARPDSADWWSALEVETGVRFCSRKTTPTYAELKTLAVAGKGLPVASDRNRSVDCACTD